VPVPIVAFVEAGSHNRCMILDAVKRVLDTHGLIDHGDNVLVAVSGGIDSVVLLHVLARLAPELEITLQVAHLNHGWRDEASDRDEAFVRALAESLGLLCVVDQLDETELELHRGAGREGAAREVRQRFLLEASEQHGASRIATGHTRDDRAETILYNLARGAGSTGISGIAPCRGRFIRPLIETSRAEVLAFAQSEGLEWREDLTNEDVSFDRNRIRHRILPELREINPRAAEAICRAGDHAEDAATVERLLMEKLWPQVAAIEEPDDIQLARDVVAQLPRAVRLLVLRDALRRVRGDLVGIEKTHVATIIDALGAIEGHGDFRVPRGYVRVDGDRICVSATPYEEASAWEMAAELGETPLPGGEHALQLALRERNAEGIDANRKDPTIEAADADRIAFPLALRSRRPGDRFTPLGMSQPVKLKDFLINARIPFFSRDKVPLLCDQEKIIWVVGVRLSEDVRMTPDTKRILEMRLESTE